MAKDSLYSWQQMDLSLAESQTLLECRRQELLELLQDEDFSGQGTTYISLLINLFENIHC